MQPIAARQKQRHKAVISRHEYVFLAQSIIRTTERRELGNE
jgi:hypothetical protein